ncbi:MAG: tetratricopeptide repeat protein [Cyclobacteriaceae bacterium]
MRSRSLLFFILVLTSVIALPQTRLDSLKSLLENAVGNDRNQLLIQVAKEYSESSPDSAVLFANQALEHSISTDNELVQARVYVVLSSTYSNKGDYDQSVDLALRALKLAEVVKDTISIIDACNNLGIDFMFTADYLTSYQYFNRVRDLSELSRDSVRLGHAYNNLGMAEYYLENSEEELRNYQRARDIFQQISDDDGLGNALLNIGTVHTDNDRYQTAHGFYIKALQIFKELKYASAQGSVLQSISENYMKAGNLDKALEAAMNSLELLEKEAFKYDITFSYELIQDIYIRQGDYMKAHEYLKKYHELMDVIFDEEKSKQINQLHIEYETEKKQQEIALLTARDEITQLELAEERRNIVLLTITFLLTVALGTFIYFSNRKRQLLKNRLLSSEINELRAQIKGVIENTSSNFQVNREKLDDLGITPLSDREIEILNFAMSDLTNSQIAEKAFVSVNTVKFHLKNIYGKLGVGNTREALQNALQFPGS